MKVQCPECREIVVMSDFHASPAGLRFSCEECREEIFLPNPQQAPRVDATASLPLPEAVSEEEQISNLGEDNEAYCPKCGQVKDGSESCHRCGLEFAGFDPATMPPVPEEAVTLWAEITARPTEIELHEKFLSLCFRASRIEYASRCYRIMRHQNGHTDVVDRMEERILTLAYSQAGPDLVTDPVQGGKKTNRMLVWIVSLVLMGAGMALIVYSVLGGF